MKSLFICFLFILMPFLSGAEMIIGGEITYIVEKGDTLELIGAKLGVIWRNIVLRNNIDVKKPLRIGQILKVNTRKIVPKTIENGIIINIPDRMMYFFKNGRLSTLPVGLGMATWREMTRWRTPTGKFKVISKQKNPTWYVPESIRWKMEMEDKPVKTIVPPGPENPLGRYTVKISIPWILIHETIWPTSVYQFRSHGCIRVLPKHMEKFFKEVEINSPGEITYIPVKVAVSDEGKIFLEVHRDIYEKLKSLSEEARNIFESHGISTRVDWQKVERVIKEKSGIAEDITL